MAAAREEIAVGVSEAQARFSELVDRAERGETILITRRGKEAARLTASGRPTKRVGGWYTGRFWMAPDFDDTPQEIIDLFEGSDADS